MAKGTTHLGLILVLRMKPARCYICSTRTSVEGSCAEFLQLYSIMDNFPMEDRVN